MQLIEDVGDHKIIFMVLVSMVIEEVFLFDRSIERLPVEGKIKKLIGKLFDSISFSLEEIHIVGPYLERSDVEGENEIDDEKDRKASDNSQHYLNY